MNEERKTLEQRAQMTDVERLRHSTTMSWPPLFFVIPSEVEEPLAIP